MKIDRYTAKKVLVIDDDPTCLSAIREILNDRYQLFYAITGSEALTVVDLVNPDLILLDLQLPDISGFEVCAVLKSCPTTLNIPIIFITSSGTIENEIKALEMGANDFLSKPIQSHVLNLKVDIHISLTSVRLLEESHTDAISMLSEAGHYNDSDTGMHIWRMAAYAELITKEMDLGRTYSHILRNAAPLHDTGKIGIPDHILKKPGALTPEEWVIMKQHSQIGYDILSKSQAPIFKMAAQIALHHHEKWDGSGYPYGHKEERIPLEARIVAIADVFDALTTARPYKEAWPIDEAFKFIASNSGTHFDPAITSIFLTCQQQVTKIKLEYCDKASEEGEI